MLANYVSIVKYIIEQLQEIQEPKAQQKAQYTSWHRKLSIRIQAFFPTIT